jgi:hypothetical protein
MVRSRIGDVDSSRRVIIRDVCMCFLRLFLSMHGPDQHHDHESTHSGMIHPVNIHDRSMPSRRRPPRQLITMCPFACWSVFPGGHQYMGGRVTCRAPLLHRMQRVFAFPSQRVHRDSSFALGMLTMRRLAEGLRQRNGKEEGGGEVRRRFTSCIQKRNNRHREGEG